MTENNNRDFGPQDSMSWNTSSLAWVFAANTRAALDDPERRVHGYLRDVIRVEGTEGRYPRRGHRTPVYSPSAR